MLIGGITIEDRVVASLEALASTNDEQWIHASSKSGFKGIREVSKEIANREKSRMINDKETLRDKNFFKVQIQHHNPEVLSINNQVDKLSLKLSLEKISDDRIDMSIQKILEYELWYMELRYSRIILKVIQGNMFSLVELFMKYCLMRCM